MDGEIKKTMSTQLGVGQHSMPSFLNQTAKKFLKVFEESCCTPSCVIVQKTLLKRFLFNEVASDDGVDKICKSLYKKRGFTILRNAYSDFQNLLFTKRGNNESFRNFESRFAAIAKMKSYSNKALPESQTAFTLLSSSNIDGNQLISILSSATSHNAESASFLTNEELMDSVTYDPIAYVLRQWDSQRSYSTDTLCANSTSFLRSRWNRNNYTPQQIQNLRKNLDIKLAVFGATGTQIILRTEN